MKTLKIVLLTLLTLSLNSCVSSDIQNVIDGVVGGQSLKPSQNEIISGLKQALTEGASKGANLLSKPDGFLKNPLLKIAFPKEALKVKRTLDSIGLSSLTNRVETSLNRAAEKASAKALPIFANAIKNMSFSDAMKILTSGGNAATDYLKKTTTGSLKNAFSPIIQQSLSSVGATKYWGDVMSRYNQIPFTKSVNTNLNSYVTDNALKGLFSMVASQEQAIRKNPLERGTALLKKVFGFAQSQLK